LSALDDIVDRAIDFTNRILRAMPSYRSATLRGLRRLRLSLSQKFPDHPAIRRLDEYLEALAGRKPCGEP
jgi:hypothetical protein